MKFSKTGEELGASEVAGVMEIAGFKTPFKTAEQIRQIHISVAAGAVLEQQTSQAIERGNKLEPMLIQFGRERVASFATKDSDVTVKIPQKGFRRRGLKLCASLDAILKIRDGKEVEIPVPNDLDSEPIVARGRGALECKTDGYTSGPPRMDQVIQLQAQMHCSRLKWGVIARLGKNLKWELFPYQYDLNFGALIEEGVKEFWRRVKEDIEYTTEDETNVEVADLNDLDSSSEIEEMCRELNRVKVEIAEANDFKHSLEKNLREILGSVGARVATIGEFEIDNKTIVRSATPQRVIEAKPATSYERLSIKNVNQGELN